MNNNDFLKKEDYFEPQCPFCTDMWSKEKQIKAVPIDRIISKLDEHLSHKDYDSAKRHLNYWLEEARLGGDIKGEFAILNELMGIYRKTSIEDMAFKSAKDAVNLAEQNYLPDSAKATAYINAATVYKAFGKAEMSIPLFEKAEQIYQSELDENDAKLGGLYNNFGLALKDLRKFDLAIEYYSRAINVMLSNENGGLEAAISYLNMADVYDLISGEEKEEKIADVIEKAYELLTDNKIPKNGYLAFVYEKCAPVFGYYGYFYYENILNKVANEIYERA